MRRTRHDVELYDVFDKDGNLISTSTFEHSTLCRDVKFALVRYYGYSEDIKVRKHKPENSANAG